MSTKIINSISDVYNVWNKLFLLVVCSFFVSSNNFNRTRV